MSSLSAADVLVRLEEPGDLAGIRTINELAFESSVEADLYVTLQAAAAITLSMVAVAGGELVAHVLVTPVAVATPTGDESLLGLGPVAVRPSEQGKGIGTLLVSACLEQLRKSGGPGVVVLGHPGYYPRFGFIPASRWGLHLDFHVPDEAFMALELSPGRLAGMSGVVRFRPEFMKALAQEENAPEARDDRRF